MSNLERTEEAVTKLISFLGASSQSATANASSMGLFSAASNATSNRSVELDISFLQAPPTHRVPLFLTLPHEVLDGSICVVTKPPQRTYKDIIIRAQDEDGDLVARRVKKVIDEKKLEAKFQDPVAMRALAKSFDHFVVYKVNRFPKQLSGEFLHHALPPVWAPKGQFLDSVRAATRTAVVPRRGFDHVTVRIGHTGLSIAQLVENCYSLVQQLTESPDGVDWTSILQIRLCATNTDGRRPALPIFTHNYDTSHPGALAPVVKSVTSVVSTPAKAAAKPKTPAKRSRSS